MNQSTDLSEDRLLKLGDCRFENHSWGNAKPAILAFPGFMQTCHTFGKLAPLLTREGHPVLSVSLPGHGRTVCEGLDIAAAMDLRQTADRLARLFTTYNMDPVHLLAHSFGARYALAFTVRYPQYVRSLHMIAAGGFYPWEDRLFRLSGRFPLAGLLKSSLFISLLSRTTSKILNSYQLKNGVRLIRLCGQVYPAINLYDTRIMLQIYKITQPVHVYWGEEDRLVPVSYAHEVCQHFPNARKHIIPQADHNLHLTHTKQLFELVAGAIDADN